ncbi:hypothetical protein DFP73DRAFT_533473 [Morchella snyderi]|nr:hypothetical protein DFP73DRAFT_533473 [Morchella snyderi]
MLLTGAVFISWRVVGWLATVIPWSVADMLHRVTGWGCGQCACLALVFGVLCCCCCVVAPG